jgi:hypothetical protein
MGFNNYKRESFDSLFFYFFIMICTIVNINQIPHTWIFEHYCNLPERLYGQKIKINSVFNSNDHTPSMLIKIFDGNEYMFKDYSTGKFGNGVNLVKHLYNITYIQAIYKIIDDYNETNGHFRKEVVIKKVESDSEISEYKERKWYQRDADFWLDFNINSKLLKEHFVKPIESFKMTKETLSGTKEMTFNNLYTYGYFKENGDIHKFYIPKNKKCKFITQDYSFISGSEQLKNHDILIATSSMKDMLSFKSLNLDIDSIAPDSENTIIPREYVETLNHKHKFILLDNDKIGHQYMEEYKKIYNFTPIYLNYSKDLSDSVRDYGPDKIMNFIKNNIDYDNIKP